MNPVPDRDSRLPAVAVCPRCRLAWCSPATIPPPPEEETAPDNPTAARPASPEEDAVPLEDVTPTWEWVFFLGLGTPMPIRGPKLQRRPWATWILAGFITLCSLVALLDFPAALDGFALIPSDPWRLGGATLVTSCLLHGSILHLLGNVYFFLLFGDAVEDYLGWPQFLGLVMLSAAGGTALHCALEPHPDRPVLGASGAVAGILAFYALRFPAARLLARVQIIPFVLPVWTWFLLWVVVQLWYLLLELGGTGTIAALAHLGGAGVGALFWAVDHLANRKAFVALHG